MSSTSLEEGLDDEQDSDQQDSDQQEKFQDVVGHVAPRM
jgi:hypothetical protein